jgi:hypothetical protein
LGVCLIAGQRSLTQRSMAAWSRSAARRTGRCTLQPSRWCNSAHTQAGWCCTPVSRSITVAMRSRVPNPPVNPLAVAPSSKACSTVASWASDSLGAGPLGPRPYEAPVPPCCQRACQTLTAWAETSSWRACGGESAGPSPVDRRKQGLKRSTVTEAGGIPLGAVPAPANHRDDGLLAVTLDTLTAVAPLPAQPVVHLDAGYDYQPCRQVLADRGMVGQIATRGVPAPVQAGRRWVIERTHAWGNLYGKLRWCTERRRLVVAFWLALASAALVCGRLLRRAWTCYRWDGRPRRRP